MIQESVRSFDDVAGFVPKTNGGLRETVLVAERAQARGFEQEITSCRGFQSEPAGRKHAQEMRAGEQQHLALDRAYATHHAVGSRADLRRRFSSGTTVAEQLPAWTLRQNLRGAPAFVLPVVPFDQIAVGLGHAPESRQLAGPRRALQRAREDSCEGESAQPLAEPASVALAARRQRQIGESRMLAGDAPCGFAVPREVDDRERFGHDRLILSVAQRTDILAEEEPRGKAYPGGTKVRLTLFGGIRPLGRSRALRDAVAGVTLASMNIPQVLGYTRIAGTPIVTGLYTLLLPLVAFAIFGSSRHLVVAADSATAAILSGALSPI